MKKVPRSFLIFSPGSFLFLCTFLLITAVMAFSPAAVSCAEELRPESQVTQGAPQENHTVGNSKEAVPESADQVPSYGAVLVTLDGPKDAKWSLNGEGAYESGLTVDSLPVGTHSVSFSEVADWTAPAAQDVTVVKDETASVSAAYVRHVGSASVTIDGPKDAKWSLNGEGTYESGYKVDSVPTGAHKVEFAQVENWTAPAPQEITVAKDRTISIGVSYVRHVGSVSVTLDGPKDARWSLNGEGAYESRYKIDSVPTGSYKIGFSEVSDWTAPAAQDVTVVKDETSSVSAAYVRHVGSVSVTIDGPKDAKWSLNGEGAYESGQTVDALPVGTHKVGFSEVVDWTAPGAQDVSVVKDETASVSAAYVRHVGSVSVTLDGPKDAKWSLNGEGAYESGQTVDALPVGTHKVSFSEVADWTAPAAQEVVVVKDETASALAAYVRHVGSVSVTLDGPKDAKWSLNGEGAYESGQTVDALPVGTHKVTFSEVADWTAPAAQDVTVVKDETAAVSAAYVRHVGSVSVTLDGPKDAKWSLNGEGTYESGQTVDALPVGTHKVTFSEVADWTAPAAQDVTVVKDETASVSAAYVRHVGSVSVTLDGSKDAKWSLNGEGAYESGQTVDALPVGTHKVSFSEVADWTAPAAQEVTVVKDETASVSAAYVRHVGSVSVTLDGPKDAKWSLNGEGTYESGQTVDALPVGTHKVSFSEVADWTAPAAQDVTVVKDETASVSASYVRHVGSVSAIIDGPKDAKWSLNGEGTYESGQTVDALPVGTHKVTFSEVADWTAPAAQDVSVVKDETASVSAAYVRHVGSVSVTLDGPKDAKWSLNGEGTYESGQTVDALPVGTHKVGFSEIADWTAPAAQDVTVVKDETASVSAAYVRHVGSVSVTLDGPKDAKWSLNGEGAYESGYEIDSVPTGSYKISFSEVADWTAPAAQEVTVVKDETASVSAAYVRHVGSASVTIDGPKDAKWSLNGEGAYESGYEIDSVPTGSYKISFSEVADWTAPAAQEVTVVKDETASVSAAYVRHVGSVSVTLDGPKDARWSLNGEGAYESRYKIDSVPTGSYKIGFSEVSDWTAPAAQDVTVVKDETSSVSAAYVRHVGSVSVTIDGPKDAKWSLNGEGAYESGYKIDSVPTGSHKVTFSEVSDWTAPAAQDVTVVKDETASVSAVYVRHVGSVSVTLDGPKDAKWSLNGEGAYESGYKVDSVPTGSHKVTFSEVADWTAPADQDVTVVKDETASVSAVYVRHVGSVSVTLDGPKDARWNLDGEGSYESGHTMDSVPTGSHKVTFSEAADWTAPAVQDVTVVKDETASVSAVYVRHVGSVSVTIDGPKDAKWSLDGEGSYESGHTMDSVPTGSHKVTFSEAADWTAPTVQDVTVVKDETASVSAVYVRHVGSVSVTIDGPKDAKWSLNGEGAYESGHTVDSIPTGSHKVTFSEVKDWTAPAAREVAVVKDETASVSAAYVRHVGAVSVYIDGPEEARWSLNGEGSYESGEKVDSIPTGKHTISFPDIADWTTPAPEEFIVNRNATAVVSGTYVRHVGSVAVKIEGPKDAKWNLNGKGNYDSGHVVKDVPTGKYTVSFAEVPDWTKPDDTTVTVSRDGTAALAGNYIRHVGSVAVKIEGPKDAKWNLNGKGNYDSGHVVKDVPTGKYTVSFTEVPDWTKPDDTAVTVSRDGTAALSEGYIRHVGSVAVNIDGPQGAKWSLDGKGSYDSGYVVKFVPTGKYPVSFADVPDWTKPTNTSVTITRDETAEVSGAYVKHTGSVSVTIDGPREARWSLDGKGGYASGQTVSGIEVGSSAVSFSEVPGWTKPANTRVTVRNGAASRVSGTYIRHTGSVKVNITGTKDGRWSIDGKGNYPSGWTAKNIVVGNYKILFSNVSGRVKPEVKTITVKNGATTTVSAAYTQNTGSISVTIDGPKEARWSIDGRGSYTSGQTVSEILVGNHTITFSYVRGWKNPADKRVTVTRGAVESVRGVYSER